MTPLRWFALAGLVIAIVTLGLLRMEGASGGEERAVVISITGDGGQVTVNMEADGESLQVSDQSIPCDIPIIVRHKIGFSINRVGAGEGAMNVEVISDGISQMQFGGARGAIGRLEFEGRRIVLASISGL